MSSQSVVLGKKMGQAMGRKQWEGLLPFFLVNHGIFPRRARRCPGQNSRVDDMVFAGARKGSRGWGKGADFMGRIC